MDKPKREAILDLSKYVNERIRVKFTGGREGALRWMLRVSLS
jgi:U6 snRNA-associated Sm-like protein LSm7